MLLIARRRLRSWAEGAVEFGSKRFKRIISAAPADVSHQYDAESVVRLNKDVGNVHLIGAAMKQERVPRDWCFDRKPTETVGTYRRCSRRRVRICHLNHWGVQLPQCVQLNQRWIAAGAAGVPRHAAQRAKSNTDICAVPAGP